MLLHTIYMVTHYQQESVARWLDFKFDILAIQLCFFDESSLNKDIKSII